MGNLLLTGATGGIGRPLAAALGAAGHRVIAVGRDVGRLDVRGIEADLADPASLAPPWRR
ncbi:NAD-dependent epimerase/dehydratase family protein [Nonomuraea sp. NPDC001684]